MIFFALSMNFIATPGFKVKLPEASSATPVRERKNLEVVIKADGNIYIDSDVIMDIRKEMKKRFHTGMYRAVIIKADSRTPHGRVVEVLDAAKAAGFRMLAIATGPRRQ